MQVVKYDQRSMESELIDLWNKCLPFDLLTKDKFRQYIIFDDNFDNDLCLVALDKDKLVGFIYGVKRKFPYLEKGYEEDKAWIVALFVEEDYRRRGIAKELISTVEKKFVALGVKKIVVGAYSPHYIFPGVDEDHYPEAMYFFKSCGYTAFEKHYSMGMNLHGFKLSAKTTQKKALAEQNGYRFQMFDYRFAVELLTFLRDEFGGGWKYNALEAMRKNKAQDRIVIVLGPDGRICACANRAIDDNELRFGPIGVSHKHRNAGLGTILLELSLLEMAKRGIYRMFFMTTDENGRRYYERAGLKLIRSYTNYSKTL